MQILTKCKNAIKRNKAKFLIALTVMAMSVMTCMSCFAAEFTTETVTSSVASGMSLLSTTMGVIVDNPLLTCILGAGLIPVGLKIFKSARKAVK